MHAGLLYDLIQGQGHETFKVRKLTIFKLYLLPNFQCMLAKRTRSKFYLAGFLKFGLVFVSRD